MTTILSLAMLYFGWIAIIGLVIGMIMLFEKIVTFMCDSENVHISFLGYALLFFTILFPIMWSMCPKSKAIPTPTQIIESVKIWKQP